MSRGLLERTREMLADRGALTLRQVAEGASAFSDGVTVEFEWVSKLSQGVIRDPGVRKVEALHAFLELWCCVRELPIADPVGVVMERASVVLRRRGGGDADHRPE